MLKERLPLIDGNHSSQDLYIRLATFLRDHSHAAIHTIISGSPIILGSQFKVESCDQVCHGCGPMTKVLSEAQVKSDLIDKYFMWLLLFI